MVPLGVPLLLLFQGAAVSGVPLDTLRVLGVVGADREGRLLQLPGFLPSCEIGLFPLLPSLLLLAGSMSRSELEWSLAASCM